MTAAHTCALPTYAEGNTLTATKLSDPAHGSVTLNADGTFSYSHDGSETASDSFTYKTCDNGSSGSPPVADPKCSPTATVSITEIGRASCRETDNNSATVAEGSTETVLDSTAASVLANDTDAEGNTLTANKLTDPAHGSVVLNADGTFSYSHDGSETTTDSFTYKTCDNGTTGSPPVADPKCSPTATVSITVSPVNDAPVANSDSATTNEDTSVDVNVLANDTDVDNANSDLRTVSLRNVTGGTAIILLDGRTVRFSPKPDANGSDGSTFKFTYKANDGALDSASAAIVTITVNPVNDIPSFTKGADQTVNEDSGAHTALGWATNLSKGTANESGQTLDFIVSNNNNGLFSSQPAISATGTLTYTPATHANGLATVTVQIHDNGGTANGGVDTSAPQTFMITVNPVNDIPSFTKGADQTVNEDAGAQTVSGWATNLGRGPANESGQTLDFIVSNSNNGLFSGEPAVSSTGTLTSTSAPNANGVATVTVKIHDDGGTAYGGVDTSAPQTVTITVNPVNDGPVLTMSASSTGGQYSDQTSPVIALTATDIDNMGSQLTFSVDAPGLLAGLVLTPTAWSAAPGNPNIPGTRTSTIPTSLRIASS